MLLMLVATNVFAQATPVAAPTKSAETNPPAHKARSSVARVADSLAADLTHAPAKALVVAAPLVSDVKETRGAELAVLVATQLAGRRGGDSRAFSKPMSLADARSQAKSVDALVMLKVEISSGKLRVTADVFPVAKTVWARIRDPEPGPIAHAFAESLVDAEVRAFLAPVSVTQAQVVRGQSFEGDIVALGCGDIDDDGASEIISVSRRRVTTLRVRDGKAVPLRSRNWTDLSPLAPVPLREPIGLAAVVEREMASGDRAFFVDVGLSDRSKSVRLDGQLRVTSTLSGLPVGGGETSGCVRVKEPWLTGALAPCVAGDRSVGVVLPGAYDALASASLVSANGEAYAIVAGRNDRGVVEVRDDAGHVTTIDGAGAQLAVGDLDQDGEPEILTSLDVPTGVNDAAVVRTWSRSSKAEASRPKEWMRLPAASGVRAIAVCPPDGPGRAPFVVATADEIWVVR